MLFDVTRYREFVPPQGDGLLFLAEEKDYKITTDLRKDIAVRLRCIGEKHPLFDPKGDVRASSTLYASGLVEGVFLPVLNAVMEFFVTHEKVHQVEGLITVLVGQYSPPWTPTF